MNIQTQHSKSRTAMRRSTVSLPSNQTVALPEESVTLSGRKDERGGLGTMLRRGLSWSAFMGVPALAGAAGAHLGAKADDQLGGVIGSVIGGGLGQGYGAIHGGYAGWAITPGKKAGGIMLAFLTVPAGAGAGALVATGLSVAGSAGGFGWAAGLAGAGFAIGMVNGYMDPKPGQ